MRHDPGPSDASRQYTAAHAAHYKTKNLYEALTLYRAIMEAHPHSREAVYCRAQIENIVKAVVPEKERVDAQIDLAISHARLEEQRGEAGFNPPPPAPADSTR